MKTSLVNLSILKSHLVGAALLSAVLLFCNACDPASPVRLPSKVGKLGTDNLEIRRSDCKSSGGVPLEFCINGVAVTCEKNSDGEYCTQVTKELVGRMWGPF
ncbi:MAG: hypothetical protein ACO3A4_13275 [Silvanigrellaceae bacterium]